MPEYADVSIFKSLDSVSASERVAESVSVKFGDSAVDTGFERGIVAECATGWMNGNVGQQRLHATEQRVSSAGEQPSVAASLEAAQEGPDEAMKQALAAIIAKEASAASDTRTWLGRTKRVERNQCC